MNPIDKMIVIAIGIVISIGLFIAALHVVGAGDQAVIYDVEKQKYVKNYQQN